MRTKKHRGSVWPLRVFHTDRHLVVVIHKLLPQLVNRLAMQHCLFHLKLSGVQWMPSFDNVTRIGIDWHIEPVKLFDGVDDIDGCSVESSPAIIRS